LFYFSNIGKYFTEIHKGISTQISQICTNKNAPKLTDAFLLLPIGYFILAFA